LLIVTEQDLSATCNISYLLTFLCADQTKSAQELSWEKLSLQ